MDEYKSKKRYLYAVAGVIVLLFAGFVYAWSILSAPIAADYPQWTNAQLSLTFTICIGFFCLGGMAAGFLSKKIPTRFNVIISAALFLVAFFLTSRAKSLAALYLCYGVLGGTAAGFSYNSVMNVIPRWFPDRQGLISGVLLMGFGASSMVIGALFTAITPEVTGAWRDSMLLMGVLMAVIIFAGSFFVFPPKTPAPKTEKTQRAADAGGLELAPLQMLRRPSFYFFFMWTVLLSAAGLVIIGQAKNVAQTVAPAMSPGTISFVVGLISVCNGLGRVIFGAIYDRTNYKFAMLLVIATSAVGGAILWLSMTGSAVLLVLGFIGIGLGYGGCPVLNASVTKRFYGEKNYPVNFSIIGINLLVASFAATGAGAILDATNNSFTMIFVMLFVLIALALVSCLSIRKP